MDEADTVYNMNGKSSTPPASANDNGGRYTQSGFNTLNIKAIYQNNFKLKTREL